jgi:hypothetical protein
MIEETNGPVQFSPGHVKFSAQEIIGKKILHNVGYVGPSVPSSENERKLFAAPL